MACSRVNDARTAQQFGVLIIVPLTAVLVAQFTGSLWLSAASIAFISLGLVGVWLRRDMAETEQFEENKTKAQAIKNPLLLTLKEHPRAVAQLMGFTLLSSAAPAFADVARGDLRLLLSGPASSAGRPMPDGTKPVPGGWNRIEFVVDDIVAEVDRLRGAGLRFRNDIVTGPGGSQILFDDPSGNPIELFQPAQR